MNVLNREYWIRALRDPLVITGFVIDLLPLLAVILWGWGAGALVVFYWVENVLIGCVTIPRILLTASRQGAPGIIGGALLAAFFTFHYGMFCLVHGIFVMSFIEAGGEATDGWGADAVVGLMQLPEAAGQHMPVMISILAVWQAVLFLTSFVARGEWRMTNPTEEMQASYGRVVVLHIGLFAGAAALVAVGDPMIGVFGLIVLRAIWGIWSAGRRNYRLQKDGLTANV